MSDEREQAPLDRHGMLHHVSFGVSDIEASARFYDAVLGALGYVRVWEDLASGARDNDAVGYGRAGSDDEFAIKQRNGAARTPGAGFHLAFAAPNRAAVDRFHAAALRLGGNDNGAPGLRIAYGPNYYAAFVTDPDGYAIEAVINSET
jgi:catechol 2,3-dioxygenase-like lactoylglutathione lyase family enzyme